MKNKGRYTGAIVAGVLLALGIICAVIATSSVPSKYGAYRAEAITILEKYKNTKYTESEAEQRLSDLESDVNKAKMWEESQVDKDRYAFLEQEIRAIRRALNKGAVRDTDVDTSIRHIRDGR